MNDDNLGSTSSAGSDRHNGVAWERATLEKLVFATIREQQAARRWKMFTRFMWLAFLGAIVWFLYTSADMTSATSTPHTAVVEIKGEIANGADASAEFVVAAMKTAFEDAGAKGVVWGPFKDIIDISHGPIGCGQYSRGGRRKPATDK